jgi:hypothetical protein
VFPPDLIRLCVLIHQSDFAQEAAHKSSLHGEVRGFGAEPPGRSAMLSGL